MFIDKDKVATDDLHIPLVKLLIAFQLRTYVSRFMEFLYTVEHRSYEPPGKREIISLKYLYL